MRPVGNQLRVDGFQPLLTKPEDEMAAFDILPRALRDVLNYSPISWTAVDVVLALGRGVSLKSVYAGLLTANRKVTAQNG